MEKLREVKLGQKPEDYNPIFDNVLDVVNDYFEVHYANRWDGRIETYPLFEKPHLPPRSPYRRPAATTQPRSGRCGTVASLGAFPS